jgi:hypothetical protein
LLVHVGDSVVNAGLWQLAKNPSPVIRHMRTALLPIIGLAVSARKIGHAYYTMDGLKEGQKFIVQN